MNIPQIWALVKYILRPLFMKNKSTAFLKQRSLLFFKLGRSPKNQLQDAGVGVIHVSIYQH